MGMSPLVRFREEPRPWYDQIVDDAAAAYREAVLVEGYDWVNVGYYIEAAVERALSKNAKD